MKVSRKYHVRKKGTGKGKVRKNPKKDILVIGIATKDWKGSWTNAQLIRAATKSKLYGGKIADKKEMSGTDSDALYVYKGISRAKLEALDDDYGWAMGGRVVRATSTAELEQKLKNIMKKEGLGGDKYCIFGCGRILDPDRDHENSCRWCE